MVRVWLEYGYGMIMVRVSLGYRYGMVRVWLGMIRVCFGYGYCVFLNLLCIPG